MKQKENAEKRILISEKDFKYLCQRDKELKDLKESINQAVKHIPTYKNGSCKGMKLDININKINELIYENYLWGIYGDEPIKESFKKEQLRFEYIKKTSE